MTDSTATLNHVTSKDGTTIGFDRLGSGPPVVLVCGGSVDRQSNAGLAAALASELTVFNYDRRGRGDSGDTLPYAIEREVEDIAAVVEAAGGSAGLYGISSGGALALHAAAALPGAVRRLAIYEAPYFVNPEFRPPLDSVAQYEKRLAAGHPEEAAEYFMAEVVRMPPDFVAWVKSQPFFADSVNVAHTLPYDGRVMGDYLVPTELAGRVAAPTLVLAGGADFPFMPETAQAIATAIPNARYVHVEGQGHAVEPAAIAPLLREFFAE